MVMLEDIEGQTGKTLLIVSIFGQNVSKNAI